MRSRRDLPHSRVGPVRRPSHERHRPRRRLPNPLRQCLPGAAGAGGPQETLPVYGDVNVMSKIFNPDVAVVGDFLGAAGSNPIESLPAFNMRKPKRPSRPSSIPMPGQTSFSH